MSWCYDDAFRRVHVLFTAPEWAEVRGDHLDVDRFIANLVDSQVNCIQLYAKDHWGYCYYKSTQGIRFHKDLLGAVLPKAHAAGIKVLAYFSVGFDEYALGRHPDWRAIDQRGLSRRFRKLFAWACLNTPYREFALQQVEEIVSQYPVDGFWVDIVPIVMDGVTMGWNWPPDLAAESAQYPVPCYCTGCRKKFRRLYGRDIPLEPNEEERIVSYQFLLDEAAAFVRDFRSLVQRYLPEAIVMYNAGGALEDAIDDSDANCAEGLAPAHSFQSFTCRWALSKARPYEIITSSGLPGSVKSTWQAPQAVLFDHWTQKPAELLQLESSIAAAHGGNATIGLMPFASGRVEDGQFPSLRATFDRFRKMETYVKDVQRVADVGLVMSIESYRAPHRWAGAVDGAFNFHEALLQGHFQYDVVHVSRVEDYARYRVVVLANQLTLSDAENQRLRDYVSRGGRLIVLGGTSLYDETGRARDDFGLADVMGVHYRGRIQDHFAYMRLANTPLGEGLPRVPILVNNSPLNLEVDGAEVLARVARPEALRTEATAMIWGNPAPDDRQLYPLVTRNRFGQGECLSVGVSLETRGPAGTWPRQMATNLVDLLLENRCLTTNAPPGVEVVWNKKDGTSIIHLVNHQVGDAERLSTSSNRLVLHDLTLRLSGQAVGSFNSVRAMGDVEVEIVPRSGGNWLEIDVPAFCVHTALILE